MFSSPSCESVTGHAAHKALEDPNFFASLLPPGDCDILDRLNAFRENDIQVMDAQCRILHNDGKERELAVNCRKIYENRELLGIRTSFRDVTDRVCLERDLAGIRQVDHLTGLPNRVQGLDLIAKAMEKSKQKTNYHYAVIFVDIDRLKTINVTLGPSLGDELIRQTGQRLRTVVGEQGCVARLGGDEFVVVLENFGFARQAIEIVKEMQNALDNPFQLHEHEVTVTASMGIVLGPALYDRPEDLLRNANIAMRRAKQNRRNRFIIFHTGLLEETIRQMEIEIDLQKGLKRNEFHIQYQPIISLETREMRGLEALLRWNHPRRGLIPPMEFIPVAEATDFIVPLGRWVLKQACAQMAAWQRENPAMRPMHLSVNLSARQLAYEGIVDHVKDALASSSMNPALLKLEITESVAMENPDLTAQRLGQLKQLGLNISIDDFGTGYSSLSYLQRFPIDTIKVDQYFVGQMDQDIRKRKIVRSIISLAHNLGLKVVAEGVEMDEQWSMLKVLDCEDAQGFLFSRPLDADKVCGFNECIGNA